MASKALQLDKNGVKTKSDARVVHESKIWERAYELWRTHGDVPFHRTRRTPSKRKRNWERLAPHAIGTKPPLSASPTPLRVRRAQSRRWPILGSILHVSRVIPTYFLF